MCGTQNPFLGVTKQVGETSEVITRVEIEKRINAGIMWRAIGDGMVPIFEEHAARSERGYTIEQWYAMNPMERAMVVALRRVDNAMKNHYAEAESKAMKREHAKARRK